MFNDNDLKHYRGLKKVISKGDYNLKGEAVTAVSSLFAWYDNLGKKIECDIATPLSDDSIKEVAPKEENGKDK